MTSTPDLFDHLRLIRTSRVGPIGYRQLISRFGGAKAALDALPEMANHGGRSLKIADKAAIEREMGQVERLGARYLLIGSSQYPAILAEMENAPPALIIRGNIDLLRQNLVAIVGARNASAGACRFARGLAYDLSAAGFPVVSGLARGIDTAAHVGALDTGTIAVIAGGIDVTYPPENGELQAAIGDRGLLVAEMPPGTEPRARHFPHRNRIIAGLSLGTVVIEAAPKSGSLITARLAGDLGREVMAVPGSPLDPRSQGCNQLIREGATLIQDAADVAEQIRPMDARMVRDISRQPETMPIPVSPREQQRIVDLISGTYISVDELVRQSEAPAASVQMALLELELAGKLERGAGGTVRIAL